MKISIVAAEAPAKTERKTESANQVTATETNSQTNHYEKEFFKT